MTAMPAYGLSGVNTTAKRSRFLGVGAITVMAVVSLVWWCRPADRAPSDVTISLLTQEIGEGIGSGVDVRISGVKIGSVQSVQLTDTGIQRIDLQLEKSQLFDLTDTLSIDYALGNLFGITEIELHPGEGGIPLDNNSVVDLTGANGDRVRDSTMSTLLDSLGRLTGEVLTPKLTSILATIAHDTKAFTPLLQSIIATADSIAETQRLPSSFMLAQFGDILAGLPPTTGGITDFLYSMFSSDYMKNDQQRIEFDATIALLRDDLIPSLTRTLGTGEQHYSKFADIFPPLLNAIARTIPTPQRSGQDLGLLLDRLSNAFHESADGPVLNLDIALRGVPGLAVPLLNGSLAPIAKGDK